MKKVKDIPALPEKPRGRGKNSKSHSRKPYITKQVPVEQALAAEGVIIEAEAEPSASADLSADDFFSDEVNEPIERAIKTALVEAAPAVQRQIGGISPEFIQRAMDNGLDQHRIIAAITIGLGQGNLDAAAQAGVTTQTIRTWMRDPVMRSLAAEVTAGMTDIVRAEAMRELSMQLNSHDDRTPSGKDIFDWVRLAMTGAGSSPSSSVAGSSKHQHVHFHGDANSPFAKPLAATVDSEHMTQLTKLAKDLTGEQKRRIAEALRATDA